MATKSLPKEEVKLPKPELDLPKQDTELPKPDTELHAREKELEKSPVTTSSHPFSPILKLMALLVVFVLILSSGYVLLQNNSSKTIPASPTPSIAEQGSSVLWNVSKQNLNPTEQEIKNAFSAYVPSSNLNLSDNRRLTVVDIQTSSISANFAFASMQLRDSNNQILPTDGITYFLYKTGDIWKIMNGSENNFCNVIKTFPSDLLTQNVKAYLVGCFPKQ